MRPCASLLTLVFVLLLWCPRPARAQLPQAAREALAAAVGAELASTKTPGAAVALVRDDRVVWAGGFGVSNVETHAPVTPDMLFRLGSTTKMFTASAVSLLATQGRVSLDAPIGGVVKGLHASIGRLTPRQLLSHMSGLRDEAPMFGRHDDAALAEQARLMDAGWFFTEPDRVYSYSNPAYWLAGLTAQEAGGKPYADLLAELIFTPLGMARTTVRPTMAMTYPLAQGHELVAGVPAVVRPAADNSASWPAGSIFSSALDLARWVITFLNRGMLDGSRVLPAALFEMLVTPRSEVPGADAAYGFGLRLDRFRDMPQVGHGGSRAGYGSTILMLPDKRIGVVIVANRTGSGLPNSAMRALELLLGFDAAPTPAEPTGQPVSASEAVRLAGRYAQTDRHALVLDVTDGQLHLKDEDGHDYLVSARGRGAYAATRVGGAEVVEFVIVPDANGAPAFLHRGGRSFARR